MRDFVSFVTALTQGTSTVPTTLQAPNKYLLSESVDALNKSSMNGIPSEEVGYTGANKGDGPIALPVSRAAPAK